MNKKMRQIVGEEIDNVMKNDSEGKYASTLQDEELTEGVTYLYAKNTGLPFDIIVDCGRTYEYYGHPLCLYIVNGDNVIPINITKNINILLNVLLKLQCLYKTITMRCALLPTWRLTVQIFLILLKAISIKLMVSISSALSF